MTVACSEWYDRRCPLRARPFVEIDHDPVPSSKQTPSLRARCRGVKNYAYVSSGGMYKDSDEVRLVYLCVCLLYERLPM